MRRPTRPAPRAAFTLIELLVVISILALMAAFVAGGLQMVRTAQMSSVTEQTLLKLQKGLDGQWKAIADECRKDAQNNRVPQNVREVAGGDPDRAAALWAYLRLRNELPQSFAEVVTPVTVASATGSAAMTRPSVFNRFAGTFVPVPSPAEQSAALLYAILTDTGRGGTAFPTDDVTTNAQGEIGPFTWTPPNGGQAQVVTFRVFRDAWGTPITFRRFFSSAELQQASYVNTKAASRDSLDPLGKLATWTDAAGKTNAQAALGAQFDGLNKLATVVSSGADKDGVYPPTGDDDDMFGFRLTRQGNKGD